MNVPKSTKATTGHYQALMKGRLIFDSHGYVKRMTGGGFNEQQAETLAAEQADLLSNLATRQDIESLRDELEEVKRNMATKDELAEVKQDLEEVKQNMATKDELAEVKQDLEEVKQNMATKQDIALIRQEMGTQRAALMAALTQNKVDMIKWMTGYFLSGLALMSAVMTAVVKLA